VGLNNIFAFGPVAKGTSSSLSSSSSDQTMPPSLSLSVFSGVVGRERPSFSCYTHTRLCALRRSRASSLSPSLHPSAPYALAAARG
jgi:hypothetical protein